MAAPSPTEKTGILSDAEIVAELNRSVVISPFHSEQLGNCSYDVTLGPYFYRKRAHPQNFFFCPWNPAMLRELWEDEHWEATRIEKEEEASRYGCQVGDAIIVLEPNETILAHTNEFIGGRIFEGKAVTTMMKARSSMGRSCISVCKCAGQGDCGFYSKWCCEIQNAGVRPVVLIVGQKIGQIVFFWQGVPLKSYEEKGTYQKAPASDLEAVKAAWKPADMLPKLKRIEYKEESDPIS